jgi:hypothetical protein
MISAPITPTAEGTAAQNPGGSGVMPLAVRSAGSQLFSAWFRTKMPTLIRGISRDLGQPHQVSEGGEG